MDRTSARLIGAAALGAALVGAGAFVGASVAGRRIRSSVRADIDDLLPAPEDVVHRTITARDGASLHLVERGRGRPLLLLHGVTLQWWVWGAQLNTMADRYRVIAWDMRGHGRSTVGSEGITLEAVADDIADVLSGLDLRDAIVVGHSMGGMALGRFCARHEDEMVDRCAGLMFLDTSAAPFAIPALERRARTNEVARRIAYAGTSRPRLHYGWSDSDVSLLMARAAFGRNPSGAAIGDVLRMLAAMDQDNLVRAGRAIIDHDVRRDLAHVKVPSMVVVGDADRLTPVRQAKVLADAIPGSVLRVLPGIGHQTMQEAPERLAELIDELGGGLVTPTGTPTGTPPVL